MQPGCKPCLTPAPRIEHSSNTPPNQWELTCQNTSEGAAAPPKQDFAAVPKKPSPSASPLMLFSLTMSFPINSLPFQALCCLYLILGLLRGCFIPLFPLLLLTSRQYWGLCVLFLCVAPPASRGWDGSSRVFMGAQKYLGLL